MFIAVVSPLSLKFFCVLQDFQPIIFVITTFFLIASDFFDNMPMHAFQMMVMFLTVIFLYISPTIGLRCGKLQHISGNHVYKFKTSSKLWTFKSCNFLPL